MRTAEAFSDTATLRHMLRFEAALAHATAAAGLIPKKVAPVIAKACDPALYDPASLAAAARRTATLTVPVVKALTEEVAKRDAEAAGYVHWGATSQDVIDSAQVLELRVATDALVADLNRAIEAFTALAGRHRRTAAVARTELQHALPMPFGLKLAGYAAALARARERLRRLRKEALALQFGGAAGTLAALGERGLEIEHALHAHAIIEDQAHGLARHERGEQRGGEERIGHGGAATQ